MGSDIQLSSAALQTDVVPKALAIMQTADAPAPKRARITPPGRCCGVVKFYNVMKGWGFLTSDDVENGADVYFQRRDLPENLQSDPGSVKGATLLFTPKFAADGKPQA